MNIQVWRPEHERAGRHFVYTTRYVNFFVRLLIQIGDTASLESLAKKIRKKVGDFIGHADLWDSICGQYMKLLRSKGDIPYGNFDRMFKTVPLEVFMLNADRLDTWAHQPTFDSPLIELIREAMELRKLNSNLMKATGIDDLVGDAYACIYEKALPEIIARSNDEENRVRMRVDQLLTGPEPFAANTPPPDQAGGKAGDVPATKTRTKGVTRREVQKRAEALVARSPAATLAAANAAKTADPDPDPEPEAEAEAVETVGLSPQLAAVQDLELGAKEPSSSVPGSVHDSADDESELTEVEEFVDAPEEAEVMYPDLRGASPGRDGEQGFDEEMEDAAEEEEELDDEEEEL